MLCILEEKGKGEGGGKKEWMGKDGSKEGEEGTTIMEIEKI